MACVISFPYRLTRWKKHVIIKRMRHTIEPGLLRIFRYFTNVALVYFAIIWIYGLLTTGSVLSLQVQMLVNLVVYLGLAGYLSWSGLEKRLKQYYLPIALAIATIIPVMSNFIYIIDPSQANINTIISRSWLWLPVLLVPLVLIAWQYNFRAVLAYTILTNGLELIVLLVVVDKVTVETLPLLGVPFIRAFSFGVVGDIVCNLIDTQRLQKRKLIQANIQIGQAASTLEHLAVSRERNRLASELHDILAHTLSGLAVNLEAMKTLINPEQTEVNVMLDRSLQTTRLGLDETRRALKALHAQPLDELGLLLAMKHLVNDASERAEIQIEFVTPDKLPTLPPDVEQSVYRITQEALENIVRHADASSARVELSSPNNRLELIIQDDGHGFDPAAVDKNNRFGLRGMQQRASAIGADLEVISRPEKGTSIHFVWERYLDQGSDL